MPDWAAASEMVMVASAPLTIELRVRSKSRAHALHRRLVHRRLVHRHRVHIARIAAGESGVVRPGTWPGKRPTPTARARSTTTVTASARSRQGSTFSSTISAAITTIQVMLITPSANKAAISAHDEPTQ